jgi:phosphoesterase RecJ-like protein
MQRTVDKIHELILGSKNILIISHRKPDADTLGAALALKLWLVKNDKYVVLACKDKPKDIFSFIPFLNDFVGSFDLYMFDLVVFVDVGASYMTHFHLKHKNLFSAIPSINIDHHPSNDMFADINLVDPEAASTTTIIYRLFREWNVEMDSEMATCLLAGIYGDTGSFKHANTSEEVYQIASDLMSLGAKISDVSRVLFRTKSVKTLKLWGRALENAKLTDSNVLLSILGELDYTSVSAGPDHLSGVVEYLNMVPNIDYALLINDDRKGNVRGSMRTSSELIDLSKIASVYGGGGHKKASGFCIPGKIDDLSKKILDF